LAAREGIKARQLLLTGIKESAHKHLDTQQLKAELNKTLGKLDQKSGTVKSVIMQRDGNTLIEVDSDSLANWFANKINRAEFCNLVGDDIAFKTRLYKVLAYNVPINLDTSDDKHREEINEANGLEDNTIMATRWAKPPNRRSPHQRSAHLVLSYADPFFANRAISNGIAICNKRCHAERVKNEPIRCLRCQGWNHMARDCPETSSKCGNCAEGHKTAECTQPRKTRCVSCGTNDHASWSRDCPALLRRVDDYNERNPENLLPFFPTSDPWTWSRGDTDETSRANRRSAPKKINQDGKKSSHKPREVQWGTGGIAMGYIGATNGGPPPVNPATFGPIISDDWWTSVDDSLPGPSSTPAQPTQIGNTGTSDNDNNSAGLAAPQTLNPNILTVPGVSPNA
jgi:hypothetical protein